MITVSSLAFDLRMILLSYSKHPVSIWLTTIKIQHNYYAQNFAVVGQTVPVKAHDWLTEKLSDS